MMRRAGQGVLMLAVLAPLGACVSAPTFGPRTDPATGKTTTYGYADRSHPDGGYVISVVAPSGPQAHAWWDQRAGMLCAGAAVAKNLYSASRPTVLYESYGGRPGDFLLEGLAQCAASNAEAAPAPAATDMAAPTPSQ